VSKLSNDDKATSVSGNRRIFAVMPLIFFVIVLSSLWFGVVRHGDETIGEESADFHPVNEVDLPVLGDSQTRFSLPSGEFYMVNFWASWCRPCLQEHPYLIKLSEEANLNIYGINYMDSHDKAQDFLTSHGNPYKNIGVDDVGKVAIDWGLYGIPESFFVNDLGIIFYHHKGEITAEDYIKIQGILRDQINNRQKHGS